MSTLFNRTQSELCTVQVACEGNYVLRRTGSKELCASCERAIAKRNRKPRGLRGEHYMNYEESR